MLNDYHVEGATQVWGTHARRKWSIRATCLKEVFFCSKRLADRLTSQDILLRASNHTNVTKLERVYLSLDNIDTVGAIVHQIYLCQNTDCAVALRVNPSSEF